MAILNNSNGQAAGFACSSEDIEKDWTSEYEESLNTITPGDRLRTVKRELATALFLNRNLRYNVNSLAQTLGSLLRDLTQQENTLQTALRAVSRIAKEKSKDGDEEK